MSKLIGLYGGTFDPVHKGHVHAARAVQTALELDSIQWVLAARPGHRSHPATTVAQRWEMLSLMCAAEPGFVANDTELRTSGTSYTYHTLRSYRQAHPAATPCWILGLDAFATLNIWLHWQKLLAECNLVVVARPGQQVEMPAEVDVLHKNAAVSELDSGRVGQILQLHLPMLEISATDIRQRIAGGLPYEHLLTAPVSTYIKQHSLYTENIA